MLIAAIIIGIKLFSILGTYNGEEDDPTREKYDFKDAKDDKKPALRLVGEPEEATEIKADLPQEGRGLAILKNAEPDFEEGAFLKGAARAYEMILQGFAHADKELLQQLLSPPMFEAFSEAINTRQQAGQSLTTTIEAIKKALIDDVTVTAEQVAIAVRFRTEISSYICDQDGNLCDGESQAPRLIEDIWCFERALHGADNSWQLVATESVNA